MGGEGHRGAIGVLVLVDDGPGTSASFAMQAGDDGRAGRAWDGGGDLGVGLAAEDVKAEVVAHDVGQQVVPLEILA